MGAKFSRRTLKYEVGVPKQTHLQDYTEVIRPGFTEHDYLPVQEDAFQLQEDAPGVYLPGSADGHYPITDDQEDKDESEIETNDSEIETYESETETYESEIETYEEDYKSLQGDAFQLQEDAPGVHLPESANDHHPITDDQEDKDETETETHESEIETYESEIETHEEDYKSLQDFDESEKLRYEELYAENKVENNISDGSSSARPSVLYGDSGLESSIYTSEGTVRSVQANHVESFDLLDARSLIQAYKPLIIRTVQAVEILEYIPDLAFEDVERIRSIHLYSPAKAAEVLLDKLKPYRTERSWRTFLPALIHSEYMYLYDLLTRRTEKHHFASVELLRLLRPELRERIYLPTFLDLVFEHELINVTDKSEIEAILRTNGEIAAAGAALDRISKRKTDWDRILSDILEKCDMHDLADLFNMIQHPATNAIQGETKLHLRRYSQNSHYKGRESVLANSSKQPRHGKLSLEREIAEMKRHLIDLKREIRHEAMTQSCQMNIFSEALTRIEHLLGGEKYLYEDDCNPYNKIADY